MVSPVKEENITATFISPNIMPSCHNVRNQSFFGVEQRPNF